jgi:Flp pilus assembly protein TadG
MTTAGSTIRGRAGRDERGSFAVELAAGFGAWVLGIVVLATAYQIQASSNVVAHAAREAARAASLAADPMTATRVAEQTVVDRLASSPCEPGTAAVEVDTTRFGADGAVTVTVTCRTDPPIGPDRSLTAFADEVIDRFRGGG